MAVAPIIIPQRPGCIAIGLTGEVCKMDESYVVKHPKVIPGETTYNDLQLESMVTERQIYERLGPHKGILPYYGPWDDSGAIKLAYAKEGDLEAYISAHHMPPKAVRLAWIKSLLTAFYHIYSKRVLHQDTKLNNILVDDGSLKVADFANGAIFPPDADMEKIYAEDPLSKADILAIGCIIYSIATWTVYNYDFYEENRFPRPDEVPGTEGLMYREIIDRCWRDGYSSIRPLYEHFQQLEREKPMLEKEYGKPRVDFMLWFCVVPSLLFISGHYLCLGLH
ncbi:hypothetical protein FQN49_008027 [Arthroderma sp. PD_2]|nr:hypothetical protein FQN49_008027 [Arthroderma sp. PD_2]